MLSHRKWGRSGLTTLMVVALLSGSFGWAAKPVKPPPEPEPEPDPPPVMYTITWIVGFATTTAASINSDGHIVGTATSLDRYEGEEFAYIYTPGIGAQDLNELLPEGSGWYLWTAYDVNDYGQVVGEGYFTGVETRLAYRYTPASLTADGVAVIEAIGPLQADDQRTSPRGINENGEVCGFTKDAGGQIKTWFYSDDLKVEPDDSGMMVVIDAYSIARGINESAQIIAESGIDTLRVAPPFAAPAECFSGITPWDINDSGHFVGCGRFEVPINKKRTTIEYRAIWHDGTTMFDLGAGDRSSAYGINNNGDVVGRRSRDPYNGYNTSWVYLEDFQQLVNLDDAIDYCDEEELLLWLDETTEKKAWRINNAGQIAGRISNPYFPNPGPHAFILNPVPATP
jgi:uncharacterized membrane protein